jgi:hypothetical protein
VAHAFDHGLSRPLRTMIRDGVVALLQGLTTGEGGYLRAVVPFGGIVRGYTDELGVDLLWQTLNGRSPAIAVGLGDRVTKPNGMGGYNHSAELELVLYVMSNHQRSISSGRTSLDTPGAADTTKDPGLEVILEHAEELIIGQRLGGTETTNPIGEVTRATSQIKQVIPTREEELRTDNTATLWAQRYAITVLRTINPRRGVTQMLEELRTVLRNSDEAVEDIVAEDQVIPGDAVVELQNTTVDYVEPEEPEEP